MEKETKYFAWYDDSNNTPYYGPHMRADEQIIGKKLYHTLDDLLKMDISESIKKRLKGAKIGSKIKIHYLHSNGDLMVKRINPEDVLILEQINFINHHNREMEKEICENNGKRDKFIKLIFGKKNE
jgi:hypothetical protein